MEMGRCSIISFFFPLEKNVKIKEQIRAVVNIFVKQFYRLIIFVHFHSRFIKDSSISYLNTIFTISISRKIHNVIIVSLPSFLIFEKINVKDEKGSIREKKVGEGNKEGR